MKQYFTYDYVPIDPPPQNNSKKHLPKPAPGLQYLLTEPPGTEDTGLVDVMLPSNSRNTTPDHLDDLEKKNPHLISRNPSDNSKW